jgi:hypothetical protein
MVPTVIESAAACSEVTLEREMVISLDCAKALSPVAAVVVRSAASFGKLTLKADPASIWAGGGSDGEPESASLTGWPEVGLGVL